MGDLVNKFDEPIHPHEVRLRLHKLETTLEEYREGMQQQNESIQLLIKLLNRIIP